MRRWSKLALILAAAAMALGALLVRTPEETTSTAGPATPATILLPGRGPGSQPVEIAPAALAGGIRLEGLGPGGATIEALSGSASMGDAGRLLAGRLRLAWGREGARGELRARATRIHADPATGRTVLEFDEGLEIDLPSGGLVAGRGRLEVRRDEAGRRRWNLALEGEVRFETRDPRPIELICPGASIDGDEGGLSSLRADGPIRGSLGSIGFESGGGLALGTSPGSSALVARLPAALALAGEGWNATLEPGARLEADGLEAPGAELRLSGARGPIRIRCEGNVRLDGPGLTLDGRVDVDSTAGTLRATEVLIELDSARGRIRHFQALGRVRLAPAVADDSALEVDQVLWDRERDVFTIWQGADRRELDWSGRFLQSGAHAQER